MIQSSMIFCTIAFYYECCKSGRKKEESEWEATLNQGATWSLSKAWFPLNVSVIATNRSCLLARTLLHFAGFHRQPSFDLLRGRLYLEACKPRSTSSI